MHTTQLMTPRGTLRRMSREARPAALVLAVAGWALVSAFVPAIRRVDAMIKARSR